MTESISVYEVFDDVLERLQPTHILTQIHCQVCAVSLARRRAFRSCPASQPAVRRIVAAELTGARLGGHSPGGTARWISSGKANNWSRASRQRMCAISAAARAAGTRPAYRVH